MLEERRRKEELLHYQSISLHFLSDKPLLALALFTQYLHVLFCFFGLFIFCLRHSYTLTLIIVPRNAKVVWCLFE